MATAKITDGEARAALTQYGSQRKAAAALGVAQSTLQYHLKGTSTLYDAEGNVKLQWVKEEPDKKRYQEELLERLKLEMPKAPHIQRAKINLDEKHLSLYPVGDPHMGLLTWGLEVGADWDLRIANEMHLRAIGRLSEGTRARTGLLAFMGDNMHYDSFETLTPKSKNQLDSDSRFSKVAWRTVAVVRSMINQALMVHEEVLVIILRGNHDPSSSVMLELAIKLAYEDQPRVKVLTSPKQFQYHQFGKVLFGFTHGDSVRMERLPILMAADQPEAWGASLFRYWWTGHIHQRKVLDAPGVVVESLRILAPADAWGYGSGYRPHRAAIRVDYDSRGGEFRREMVTPELLA